MKAVVLAGGKGTRLRPLTYVLPKPLIPVGGKPMLEHIVEQLAQHNIKELIFAVGYKADLIKDYFKDGSKWGVSIEYFTEDKPLGTAGCLLPLREKLKNETFLLIAGDNVTKINFTEFVKFHKKRKGIASVAFTELPVPCEFGIADIDKTGKIASFKEKPTFNYKAATCIMCLEPEVFKYIPKGFSNIPESVFPKLLKSKKPRLFGYTFHEFWADVGRLEEYLEIYQNGIPTQSSAKTEGLPTSGKVAASSS